MGNVKSISISGVLAGFVVMIASSIVLSIVSPFIFSELVRSGDMDVLLTSTGPLAYALLIIFISSAFGVFICHKVADSNRAINSILVVLLYSAFSYWLSTSPSNIGKPYPQWFVLMSYALLLPGAYTGHRVFSWLDSKKRRGRSGL